MDPSSHESLNLPDSKAVAYAYYMLQHELLLLEQILPARDHERVALDSCSVNPTGRAFVNTVVRKCVESIEAAVTRLAPVKNLADGSDMLEQASIPRGDLAERLDCLLAPRDSLDILAQTCRDYRMIRQKAIAYGMDYNEDPVRRELQAPLERELRAVEDRLAISIKIALRESPQRIGPLVGGLPCAVGENPYK